MDKPSILCSTDIDMDSGHGQWTQDGQKFKKKDSLFII